MTTRDMRIPTYVALFEAVQYCTVDSFRVQNLIDKTNSPPKILLLRKPHNGANSYNLCIYSISKIDTLLS